MLKAAHSVGISKIGIFAEPSKDFPSQVVSRVSAIPSLALSKNYLVCQNLTRGQKYDDTDLITINSFWGEQNTLEAAVKKGLGIEVLVKDTRKLGGMALGDWFEQLSDLHAFCKLKHCQLVISSGASAPNELVSGRCLDAILAQCAISPIQYWSSLCSWLKSVFAKRVTRVAA